jgi:hypothetical protein
LLNILLFLSLVVFFVWHFLSDDQQYKIVGITANYIESKIINDQEIFEIKQRIEKAKIILFEGDDVNERNKKSKNDDNKPLNELVGLNYKTNNDAFFEQNFSRACSRTKTQALEQVKSSAIYKSVDDSGVISFSDKETHESSDVGSEFEEIKYFNLNLSFSDNKNRSFYRDRISADSRKLFLLLSEQLKVKDLRQINLNVSLFSTLNDFNAYKDKVAPGLQTNSGFYTSLNNEASIVMRRNREQTLSVVRHEAVHVIMAGLYGPTPTWFNEGLAEYFENLEIHTMAAYIPANVRSFDLLKQQYHSRTLLKISDYLSLTEKQWREGDQPTMYAMGWGIIYFLMSDIHGRLFLSDFMQYMSNNVCKPLASLDFFESNYPGGVVVFQSRFYQWLMQKKPPSQHY